MRLVAILLACGLAAGALAAEEPSAPGPPPSGAAQDLQSRGDALRQQGDLEGALQAYEAEKAIGGENAEVWKRIGWAQRGMRRFATAAAALERAVALDPSDREARDDLDDLKRSRGLALRLWLGGDEPGTSRNAVDGQLWYGGFNRLELVAGYGWKDNVFYTSNKGYASAYWFYSADSYVKADFTLRRYDYSGADKPIPDSNAYDWVPRGELEISHWIAQRVRLGLDYQFFVPNFFFDKSTFIANHKVSGTVDVKLWGGFEVGAMAAILRDPSPSETTIVGRQIPNAPPGTTAIATSVVYRTEFLAGGGLAYAAEHWGASVRFIPNRDLDSGFDWSVLSSVDLRPVDGLSFNFQWIFDRYATAAGPVFAGKNGNVLWALVRCRLVRALELGAGIKYVNNPTPDPAPPATTSRATLLLSLEYRTSLL